MSLNHENPDTSGGTAPEEEVAVYTVDELVEYHMDFVRERLTDDIFQNVSPEAKEEFLRETLADIQATFSSYDHNRDALVASDEIFGEDGYFNRGTLDQKMVQERLDDWVRQKDEQISDYLYLSFEAFARSNGFSIIYDNFKDDTRYLPRPFLNPRAPDIRAASLPSQEAQFAGFGAEGLLERIALSEEISEGALMNLSPDSPNLTASRTRSGGLGVA